MTQQFVPSAEMGPHFPPCALLPWTLTLCRRKPQHGLPGDRAGKLETVDVQ